jgi:peptidyl-prolyl cis-trans isomerase C
MNSGNRAFVTQVLFVFLFMLVFSACQPEVPPRPEVAGSPTPTILSTQPPAPSPESDPTAAPSDPVVEEPLAARVGGQGISLAELQAELDRYQAAGFQLDREAELEVLDFIIQEVLLAQAAAAAGYSLDEAAMQERIDSLAGEVGGYPALLEWMQANYYTEETFRRALRQASMAALMRDQVADSVPAAVEQVRVRQILLANENQANEILRQLQGGVNFSTLAARQDPVTQGDLGWFPRGYLAEAALEEAAFALQPGEISGIVETPLGYHILQVTERELERLLEPEARFTLQAQAVQDWLQAARAQSEIIIYLP